MATRVIGEPLPSYSGDGGGCVVTLVRYRDTFWRYWMLYTVGACLFRLKQVRTTTVVHMYRGTSLRPLPALR